MSCSAVLSSLCAMRSEAAGGNRRVYLDRSDIRIGNKWRKGSGAARVPAVPCGNQAAIRRVYMIL